MGISNLKCSKVSKNGTECNQVNKKILHIGRNQNSLNFNFFLNFILQFRNLTLSPKLKQTLLSVSANALKLCLPYQDPRISFTTVHSQAGRATPPKATVCTNIQFYFATFLTVKAQSQTEFHSRNEYFMAFNTSNYKIGRNNFLD